MTQLGYETRDLTAASVGALRYCLNSHILAVLGLTRALQVDLGSYVKASKSIWVFPENLQFLI